MINVEEAPDGRARVFVEDPPVARFLFQSTAASVLWLVVRLWVGWQWFDAGAHALSDANAGDASRRALLDYWAATLRVAPSDRLGPVDDWLRGVMQAMLNLRVESWVAGAIAAGELALGLALLLGAFTGIVAAAGLLLELFAHLLTGGNSTTIVTIPLAILLILGWKNAGYLGFDRYLLRQLGAPWWSPYARGVPRAGRLPGSWSRPRGR